MPVDFGNEKQLVPAHRAERDVRFHGRRLAHERFFPRSRWSARAPEARRLMAVGEASHLTVPNRTFPLDGC
jgi:hypothetical protein